MEVNGRGELYVPDKNIALVVIDYQEKMMPAISDKDTVLKNGRKAIDVANTLSIPLVVTEQNPEKMGVSVPIISEVIGSDKVISKSDFSCFGEENFVKALADLNVDSLVICGVETHVCVLQTALDALTDGYRTFILEDACGSRDPDNKRAALNRARDLGCDIITVEMMAFETMKTFKHEKFREVSKLIK